MSLGRRIDRRRIHIFRLMLSFAPFIYTIHAQTSAQPNNYWTVHGFRIWVHYFYYICSSCSSDMVEIKTQRRKYRLSRSFAESIKKHCVIKITSMLSAEGGRGYGIMIALMEIDHITTIVIARHYALLVMQRKRVNYWSNNGNPTFYVS